jgi:hypothetical protein
MGVRHKYSFYKQVTGQLQPAQLFSKTEPSCRGWEWRTIMQVFLMLPTPVVLYIIITITRSLEQQEQKS